MRALLVLVALLAQAQTSTTLPRPAATFGFEPGTDRKLADYDQIVRYFKALDAATDRVKLFEIGKTAEGRDMILSAISSEANMLRLDRYREIARRLADSRGLTDDQARTLAQEGRTIVWLDMGLHATEVAHAQVSAEVALMIAGGETEELRRLRDNAIVLLMPVMNPDGLDIVTKWYRSNVGTPFETSPLPVSIRSTPGTTTTATGSCRTCRRPGTSRASSIRSGFRRSSTTTTSPVRPRPASGRRRWTIRSIRTCTRS